MGALVRLILVAEYRTDRCMNLAATVNVVLYDRAAKSTSAKQSNWLS